MAFSIRTYGPFEINETPTGIDRSSFWKQIGDLKGSFGVYIFAVQKNKHLYPCYVGKTTSTFRARLGSHFRNHKSSPKKIIGRLSRKYPEAKIHVFLLAVLTAGGKQGQEKRQRENKP